MLQLWYNERSTNFSVVPFTFKVKKKIWEISFALKLAKKKKKALLNAA